MRLDPISSLADLAFKAIANKYYKQLAVISAQYLVVGSKPITFEDAMTALSKLRIEYGVTTCKAVCDEINERRKYVKEDPIPAPPAAAVIAPEPAKTVEQEVMEKLKKKGMTEQEEMSWKQFWESVSTEDEDEYRHRHSNYTPDWSDEDYSYR